MPKARALQFQRKCGRFQQKNTAPAFGENTLREPPK